MFTARRAERKALLGRIALTGPSGSGKTLSALKLAKGMFPNGLVVAINTEREGPEIYAGRPDVPEGDNFQVIPFTAPYSPERYKEAIQYAVSLKPKVLLIDSLSHAWAGKGGALEIKDAMDEASRDASFSNWKKVGKMQNDMIDSILSAPCHVILTMRSKTEWLVEKNEKGKNVPKKVGTKPIQRDDIEFEFTAVLELSVPSNLASADKNRTEVFKNSHPFIIENVHGKQLLDFLNGVGLPVRPDVETAHAVTPGAATAPSPAAVHGESVQSEPVHGEPQAEQLQPEQPKTAQLPVPKDLHRSDREMFYRAILNMVSGWPVNIDQQVDAYENLMAAKTKLPKNKLVQFDKASIESLYNHLVDINGLYMDATVKFGDHKDKALDWLNQQAQDIQKCDYFHYGLRASTVQAIRERVGKLDIVLTG